MCPAWCSERPAWPWCCRDALHVLDLPRDGSGDRESLVQRALTFTLPAASATSLAFVSFLVKLEAFAQGLGNLPLAQGVCGSVFQGPLIFTNLFRLSHNKNISSHVPGLLHVSRFIAGVFFL